MCNAVTSSKLKYHESLLKQFFDAKIAQKSIEKY